MTILAIIPARSGSKRLPGKNQKLLAQKPLIAHTIRAAQEAACFSHIVVSTDSQILADIALSYGALVPCLRSEHLAQDNSEVIDAVLEVIDYYSTQKQHFDTIMLLQPTSPFRKASTIQKALALHQTTGQSVVSVHRSTLKASWFRVINTAGDLIEPAPFKEMTQSTGDLYQLNGVIYCASVAQIREQHSLYSEPTKALVLDAFGECIDIDTPYDWALAEKLIEMKEEVLR